MPRKKAGEQKAPRKRTFSTSDIKSRNERAKKDYDRIAVFAPKDKQIKQRIKALGHSSINGYIMQAVENRLEADEAAPRSDR